MSRSDDARRAHDERMARIKAELDKGRADVLARRADLCAHHVPPSNCLDCRAIAKETPDA